MPKFSVILSHYWGDWHFIGHAFQCLENQICKDFEVILMGQCREESDFQWATNHINNSIPNMTFPHSVHLSKTDGFWGNTERGHGLQHATGEYVVWLNGDNLVYPNWLSNHLENFAVNKDPISLINIDWWQWGRNKGKLPVEIRYGGVDLLNFAMTTELARKSDAFGLWIQHVLTSDWHVLEKAILQEKATLYWNRDQPVCAAHF